MNFYFQSLIPIAINKNFLFNAKLFSQLCWHRFSSEMVSAVVCAVLCSPVVVWIQGRNRALIIVYAHKFH